MELNESSLLHAFSMLCNPHWYSITIYASSYYHEILEALCEKYKFYMVELPSEIFTNKWVWCMAGKDGFVWSAPSD